MGELLGACEDIRHASGGAFDIAVAPLMRAWGFHDAADRAMRASEERLQLAMTASKDGIWDIHDTRRADIWCSPRLYELLGHGPDDFRMTRPIWEQRLHPDDRERVIAVLRGHQQDFAPYDVEYRLKCKDGAPAEP